MPRIGTQALRLPNVGTMFVLAVLGTTLLACGGTMAFKDKSSLIIAGEGPPPPEPPPPPPPPEPKRVEVTADKIVINEKIQFDFDKTTIKPESNSLLDEIVSVIKDNPQIKKIAIEGHTDGDGSDKYNLKLSDGRAKSVMEYLTSHGVDAKRLTAKGYGETKPIASNETPEGKEANRRVEFLITEQEEVKKVVEVEEKTP
jgi:outer membrane protein OmpA-like peptidoglycan-associated protein